jgi:hypothetical protein
VRGNKIYISLFQVAHLNLNQTFAEIVNVPYAYLFTKVDGVAGLAYSSFAVDGVTPLFYSILKNKLVEKPVFSFYINRYCIIPTDQVGLTFSRLSNR